MREFFEKFVEKYPDGKMNKDQFHDFPSLLRGDWTGLDKDEFDFIFRIADEDNSGTVNFMEFMVNTCNNSIFFYFAVNLRNFC